MEQQLGKLFRLADEKPVSDEAVDRTHCIDLSGILGLLPLIIAPALSNSSDFPLRPKLVVGLV
jgi:hypothetical protein